MQQIILSPQQAAQLLGTSNAPPQPQPAHKSQKVLSILSLVFTFIGIGMMSVPTGFMISEVFLTIAIMIAPAVFVSVSAILIVASVFKISTNYGISVSALVFAILSTIGGLGVMIAFSLIAITSECSYDDGDCLYISLIGGGGCAVMISQICIIVLAAVEIRRIPKNSNQIVIIQSGNGQPIVFGGHMMQQYQPQQISPPSNNFVLNSGIEERQALIGMNPPPYV